MWRPISHALLNHSLAYPTPGSSILPLSYLYPSCHPACASFVCSIKVILARWKSKRLCLCFSIGAPQFVVRLSELNPHNSVMSFTTLIRPEQAIASPLQHTRNSDPIQQPVDGLFFGNPTAGYDSYYTSISGAMYPYLYRPGDCLPNYASQCFPGASPMYIFSHSQIMRPTGKCGIQVRNV